MMTRAPLPGFRLEQYFSKWEFAARYHLTASDAQTMTLSELLALGTEDERAGFAELPLGYVETWGGDGVRAAIAATYECCELEDILTFAGAEEALFWVLQLAVEPGEHAVVTVPNYQALETIPVANGVQVTGVLLDEQDSWRLDLDAVRAALRPTTKVIAVNFPNNPTGAVPDQETWAGLVELCDSRGIRLVSDEVYRGLELDPARRLPHAADLSTRAVSINVLSKSYGLPGLRIGWVACRDREFLASLEQQKHYTSICNAGPSEFLATIALRHTDEIQARNRAVIVENLPLFEAFFSRHADLFEWAPPQGGAVAFLRYRGPESAGAFCRNLVESAGVLLLPSSVYRSELADVPQDRFRIGIARRDPQPALDAFEGFLRQDR